MRRPLIFSAFVVLGIAVDLCSKGWVFSHLADDERWTLVPGVLQIRTAENTGVAFSRFADHPALILLVSLAAITILIAIYARTWPRASRLQILALGLLLVGALGNLIDRLALQYVRDFIDFMPRLPLVGHWAVFNFADMCITAGVGLFVIAQFLGAKISEPQP